MQCSINHTHTHTHTHVSFTYHAIAIYISTGYAPTTFSHNIPELYKVRLVLVVVHLGTPKGDKKKIPAAFLGVQFDHRTNEPLLMCMLNLVSNQACIYTGITQESL